MSRNFSQKRIPTAAALIVVFLSIWVTSLLLRQQALFVGRAAPDKTPQNVTISNITSSSFTASFTTGEKTVSAISISERSQTPYTIYDDRNKVQGTQAPFYSHFITVSNLKSKAVYEFTILSDGQTYLLNGARYSLTTGPLLEKAQGMVGQIAGAVILPDGRQAEDTIVSVEIPGAQVISVLTTGNGTYTIPLAGIRTSDLTRYINLDASAQVLIKFARQDLSTTLATTLKDAATLPVITLSYQYDFTGSTQIVATASSLLRAPLQKAPAGSISIINPKEAATFVDARPLFQGTALPNKAVKIVVDADPIGSTIAAGSNGFWSFRPPVPLSAGVHKITIQTLDSFGITKKVSANFTIFASGSQIAQEATPAATITSAPSPTQTSTPTPTGSAFSPTVTLAPSPTPTPTIIPIITATPTVFIPTAIPAKPPLITPAPPGISSTIVLTIISGLLISAGTVLLFLL